MLENRPPPVRFGHLFSYIAPFLQFSTAEQHFRGSQLDSTRLDSRRTATETQAREPLLYRNRSPFFPSSSDPVPNLSLLALLLLLLIIITITLLAALQPTYFPFPSLALLCFPFRSLCFLLSYPHLSSLISLVYGSRTPPSPFSTPHLASNVRDGDSSLIFDHNTPVTAPCSARPYPFSAARTRNPHASARNVFCSHRLTTLPTTHATQSQRFLASSLHTHEGS